MMARGSRSGDGAQLVRQRDAVALERGSQRSLEVALWLDAVELRALDEAVDDGGPLGAALGVRAVEVVSAQGWPPKASAASASLPRSR